MTENRFWELIELIRWERQKDDDKVEDLILELSNLSVEEIYDFEKIMTEKLYQLDAKKYAEKLEYISSDGFLYMRAYVVAKGKDYFEKILANPKEISEDLDFETLLYVAKTAFQKKTGKSDWGYIPEKLYETYFHRKAWGLGENVTIKEYLGIKSK